MASLTSVKWLRIVVCWWIIGGLSAAADEVPRTVLAITRFSPAADAGDVAPWCHALTMDLKERLAGVDGLTVRSEEFGLRSLGLAQAAEITAEQALEAGRLVEAGRILWGTLARDGEDSARTTTGRLVELEKLLLAQLEDDAEVKSLLGQISSITVGSSVGDREADAGNLEDPAVRTLVNAGVIRERRSAWERRYLNLLRGREAKGGD